MFGKRYYIHRGFFYLVSFIYGPFQKGGPMGTLAWGELHSLIRSPVYVLLLPPAGRVLCCYLFLIKGNTRWGHMGGWSHTSVTILLLSTYATGNDCRLLRKRVSLFCTKA